MNHDRYAEWCAGNSVRALGSFLRFLDELDQPLAPLPPDVMRKLDDLYPRVPHAQEFEEEKFELQGRINWWKYLP